VFEVDLLDAAVAGPADAAGSDPVLLAERVTLSLELLRHVLVDALGERDAAAFDAAAVRSLEMIDWAEFRAEHPHVKGTRRRGWSSWPGRPVSRAWHGGPS
jgi:hypothetical protein